MAINFLKEHSELDATENKPLWYNAVMLCFSMCFRSKTRINCSLLICALWSRQEKQDWYFELLNLTASYIRREQEGVCKVAWSYCWASLFQTSVLRWSSNVPDRLAVWDGIQRCSPCCIGYPGCYGYEVQLAVQCVCRVSCGGRCWDMTVKSQILLDVS